MRRVAEIPIKHEVKLNALLASRHHAECVILRIARARACFNCFKELTHKLLVKAYPFSLLPRLSTLSSQVRQFWTISYTNTLVSRLIKFLVKLTWICHLVSLFTTRFLHLTVLNCNIRNTVDTFPDGEYSIDFALILPVTTQTSLIYI